MKKLICMLLAVILCMGAAYAETTVESCVAEAPVPGNALGFDVLCAVSDGTENCVVSPLSLACALAMAAQGADGETRRQILDALQVSIPSQVPALQEMLVETGLKQANAAFLPGNRMVPKAEYILDLEQEFGAKWFGSEETDVDQINGWIEDITDGMIQKMIGKIPEEVMLALVNAVAMDAKWMRSFDPNNNGEDIFHAPDGDVAATFMRQQLSADYGERDGVQMIRLNYRDDEYRPTGMAMYIALPEMGGMGDVLDGLGQKGIGYFEFQEESRRVNLTMPKTDIIAKNNLGEILPALGVELAFSDQADFSGITGQMPLKIGSVLQNARLILDEEGTRAAAATVVMAEATGAYNPQMIVDFNMNRPFAFVIADENSGAVCFAGIVANPIGN